jgi:hypothetical protein
MTVGMSAMIFVQWLVTFAITLAVEIVVAYPILGLVEKRSRSQRRLALIASANLLTHPVVFAATLLAHSAALIVVLEIAASVVEALVYHRAMRIAPIAIAASFLANAASLFVCLVFWA